MGAAGDVGPHDTGGGPGAGGAGILRSGPEAPEDPRVAPDPDTLPAFMRWQEMTSLVGSIRTRSLVARPTTIDECRETLAYCKRHGLTVCARGSGRGYGDVALNDGHALIDMSGLDKILEFDEENARITVQSGTRLIQIFELVHHRLLTLPSSPTESHSSVAGAICANVNGKDGWRHGSFGEQVLRMTVLTADGEVRTIERGEDLFRAFVGGIGLLGIILDATLQLAPIPSPYVEINRIPARNADALLEKMGEVESSHDAAVVWVDAYAKGDRAGRSVIHAARWIERPQEPAARKAALEKGFARLVRHREFGLALHQRFGPVISLMLQAQRPMMDSFNRLYYAMSRLTHGLGQSSNSELFLRFNFEASFTVPPAHLVCGPRGYTVQLTFPRSDARAALLELLRICRESPCPPVTTILRAHKRDEHLISFSEDGYSLNFEFHPKKRHEARSREAVDRLIDATVRRGGKIHLAKDQILRPDQFARVYRRLPDLLEIKRGLDPEWLFTSDMARRVGIGPGSAAASQAEAKPLGVAAGAPGAGVTPGPGPEDAGGLCETAGAVARPVVLGRGPRGFLSGFAAEVVGEDGEVGEQDLAVAVEVSVGLGGAGLDAEVPREDGEVGEQGLAVAVQVADAGRGRRDAVEDERVALLAPGRRRPGAGGRGLRAELHAVGLAGLLPVPVVGRVVELLVGGDRDPVGGVGVEVERRQGAVVARDGGGAVGERGDLRLGDRLVVDGRAGRTAGVLEHAEAERRDGAEGLVERQVAAPEGDGLDRPAGGGGEVLGDDEGVERRDAGGGVDVGREGRGQAGGAARLGGELVGVGGGRREQGGGADRERAEHGRVSCLVVGGSRTRAATPARSPHRARRGAKD